MCFMLLHCATEKYDVLQHLFVAMPMRATAKYLEPYSKTFKACFSIGLVLAFRLASMLVFITISNTSSRAEYLLRKIVWRRQLGMILLWVLHLALVCTVFYVKGKADEEDRALAGCDESNDGSVDEAEKSQLCDDRDDDQNQSMIEGAGRSSESTRKRTWSLEGAFEVTT